MWVKKGLLFRCDDLHERLFAYAANPIPILLGDDMYRIFFSARDRKNCSSIGAVDINIKTLEVIESYKKPLFSPHDFQSSFFANGISLGNVYEVGEASYMTFMGWKVEHGKHWYGQIGRLRLHADLSLSLDSQRPMIELDNEDPLSLSYPWVGCYEGMYRMWYGSTVEWDAGNGDMHHVIKYAESSDGKNWKKKGQVIPSSIGNAQAFSRPTVHMNSNGAFEMWYSYRAGGSTEKYSIGYSCSNDGFTWTTPKQELAASNMGWDSEMVEYPFVWMHGDQLYMLYNGNSFGKTGFGLAAKPYSSFEG